MGKTSRMHVQMNFDWSPSFAEGRPAFIRHRRAVYQGDRPINPCGRTCCGSSRRFVRSGLSPSSHPQEWRDLSSPDGRKPWNALVTGLRGELLVANTGCPNDAPDGLSSEDWASLGWPYGITYTLTASEHKGGAPKGGRANYTLGAVPTVCQVEFLQGFVTGYLHSWARAMRSVFQSLGISRRKSSRPKRT